MAEMPYNMDVLHPLYEQFETSFTNMDPATHCTDPDAYREAALCSLQVMETCFDPDGTQGMSPIPELVIEGMQVLCDRKDGHPT
nr:hypothetical protein BaRGS_032983 [Batillaria attramentaria]